MTEATVKTHLAHLHAALGLRDRAQAVVYAHEAGLLGTPANNSGVIFELRVDLTSKHQDAF